MSSFITGRNRFLGEIPTESSPIARGSRGFLVPSKLRPVGVGGPLLVAALVASVLQAAPSVASAGEHLAVIDLKLHGISSDVEGRFVAAVEGGLRSRGQEVLGIAQSEEKLAGANGPLACSVGPCLSSVGRALGVDGVVVARVSATGSSYDVAVTLLDVNVGRPRAQITDGCAVCTLDEAVAMVAGAARSVTVSASSLPVWNGVDPNAVDPMAAADSGGDSVLSKYMLRGRTLHAVRMATLVTGAVFIAAGGALLGLNGFCKSSRDSDCHVETTGVAGSVLLSAGIGLTVGGVALLLVRSDDTKPTPTGLALAGRF